MRRIPTLALTACLVLSAAATAGTAALRAPVQAPARAPTAMAPGAEAQRTAVPATAQAHDARPLSLQAFHHTAWTAKDGAPSGVWTMAQTRDGWMWFGTASGLYRFDGFVFEARDLMPPGSMASRSVSNIAPLRDGGLFVTYSSAGSRVLHADGSVQPIEIPGLASNAMVEDVAEDSAGRIWLATAAGVHVLDGTKWSNGTAWGLPAEGDASLVLDHAGRLWISLASGTFLLEPGATRARAARIDPIPEATLRLAADGRLWYTADSRQPFAVTGPDAPAASAGARIPPRASSSTQLFDWEGNWWAISCDKGVCLVPQAGTQAKDFARATTFPETFTTADGLSSENTMTLMEDRQGSIWVGTTLGVDRFRRNIVSRERLPDDLLYFALVPDRNGAMWVGTAGRGGARDRLWYVAPGARPVDLPGYSADTTAAFRDTDGALLAAGAGGAWRIADGVARPLAMPDAEQGNRVQAITRDGSGHLWLSFRATTVYRQSTDGTWEPRGGIAGLPEGPAASAVADARGRVWLGYYDNRVAIVDGGRVRVYASNNGMCTGTVTSIATGGVPIIGGELGLAWFDGTRFHPLLARQSGVLKGITGVLRARDGTLWVNGNRGGVRIEAADVARAIAEPGYPMPVRVFDALDGMPGTAQPTRPVPSIVEGSDQRIWFAATDGLAWLDPHHLGDVTGAPAVAIRALRTGDASFPLDGMAELPARTRSARIAFSALGLAIPEHATLRYRLQGVDDGWQDAGERREVAYSNLEPGNYRFDVSAADGTGAWSRQVAHVEFRIAPTFVQTRGFGALCVLLGAALLWAIYLARLRQITRQLRQRLGERHAERERIARELHDTLLQGVQALQLHVHAAAQRLPPGSLRDGLENALDRAESTLVEGRERVQELRASGEAAERLMDGYIAIAHAASPHGTPAFRANVTGRARALDPVVADELLQIGREVLHNAFAHADAETVSVAMHYGDDRLELQFRDDGRGIEPAVLAAGGKPGHWGLRGIRERAAQIRAEVEFTSVPGEGTTVDIALPARRAYRRRGAPRSR